MIRTLAEVITWFAGSLAIFLMVLNPLICELDHGCDNCTPCCGDSATVCQCPCALISVQCEAVELGPQIPFDSNPYFILTEFIPEGKLANIERPPITA